MLTRCPHCTTTFRVKPEQLKARLGRVRCGECKTVFNALDSLVEEVPQTLVTPEAPDVTTPATFSPQNVEVTPSHEAAPASEPEDELAEDEPAAVPAAEIEIPAPSVEPEAEKAAPASTEADVEPEPEAALTDTVVVEQEPGAVAEPEAAGEPETELAPSAPVEQEPVIELASSEDSPPTSESEPVADDSVAESPSETQSEADAPPLTADDLNFTRTEIVDAPAAEAAVAAEAAPTEADASPLELAATEEALSPAPAIAEHDPLLHHTLRAERSWPWVVLAVLASLLLAGQALFYYRVEVAVAAPALKPLLKAACEPLGCEVPRPRKSDMLDIESSDLHPGKHKGRLELVAVLKNKAPFAQEWPVLEVSLTDVADRALIVKALQPADYLPAGRKPTAGFPAKAEINVNLTLDAGDTPASGYRLYLYYP